MRKSSLLLVALFAAFLISVAFTTPRHTAPQELPKNIPDSIWSVFEKSCYDCHADLGNGLAKGKLNFDKWNTYDDEKQLKKSQAICEEMKKQGMPPTKYLKNIPDAQPTPAEIQRVCNWLSQIEK